MILLRKRSATDRKVSGRLPVYRVRSRKYGPVIHERTLKRAKDIALYGPHGSGKSRWVAKLAGGAAEVWPGRQSAMVRAVDPLGQWTEQPAVEVWHDSQDDRPARPWAKLKAHERIEAMVTWCGAVGAVVIVDDMHKLTGRKADVMGRLIVGAHVVVYSSASEAALPMSLRMALARRQPQVVELSSTAAYDYTGGLVWLLCIIAAAMGAWPIAAALGGLKLLGRGRNAAKQS